MELRIFFKNGIFNNGPFLERIRFRVKRGI